MMKLYKRLSAAGLSKSFVRKTAFPEWWSDDIALTQAGYAQTLMLISRNLRIDIHSLLQEEEPLDVHNLLPVLNKSPQGMVEEKLRWAQCLGERMAEVALQGTGDSHPLPKSAAAMRELLDGNNYPPHLESVLDLCWKLGVPVLYLHENPTGACKPHAMIFRSQGRYSIVLSRKLIYSSMMAFDLLHEIGHAVFEHLAKDGLIVDKTIELTEEEREEEANRFAVEVLTGNPDLQFTSSRWFNAERLAVSARSIGSQFHIDPGVIALNYAWHNKRYFPMVQNALSLLEPNADAVRTIRRYMRDRLDWNKLTEENREYLLRMSGAVEE
jgi:hypothetical protein